MPCVLRHVCRGPRACVLYLDEDDSTKFPIILFYLIHEQIAFVRIFIENGFLFSRWLSSQDKLRAKARQRCDMSYILSLWGGWSKIFGSFAAVMELQRYTHVTEKFVVVEVSARLFKRLHPRHSENARLFGRHIVWTRAGTRWSILSSNFLIFSARKHSKWSRGHSFARCRKVNSHWFLIISLAFPRILVQLSTSPQKPYLLSLQSGTSWSVPVLDYGV